MRKMMVALAMALGLIAVWAVAASAAPAQVGHLAGPARHSAIAPAEYYHNHHHYEHRRWEHGHYRYY